MNELDLNKALAEEIAKKHGFKPDKDDPSLVLLTGMQFFCEIFKEDIQTFHEDIIQQQQEFLLKWEEASKRLAERALTETLKVRVNADQALINNAIEDMEERLQKANEGLSASLSQIRAENKKEWKRFGLTQADINLMIFLLLFVQIFLFSALIWKHW